MDPKYWQLLEELFNRAVDLSAPDRQALYRTEDIPQAVQDDVEKLIAADPPAEDRRFDLVKGAIERASSEELDFSRIGEQIGDYELLRELGRGGQGVVYLARRIDSELRGQVAIKILQAGLGAAPLQQRFRQERHILSGLEHPNIAHFLDAGTTKDGSLYFVMEAVEGQPIDVYCRAHDLSLNQRLDLFCRAASAVQAAHRQLIIHRDLKSSNLLVTEQGDPKLLDFGIAKLLNPESALTETRPGAHHLTPEAASPEQVRGEALTTATDIYSLGLLLYRLLADQAAYTFARNTPSEIERVVCHSEPALPSAVSGRSELRGDLDAIVLQALRKRPDERYSSVEALVEDIRRYQRREPVRARSAGWFYRAAKFTRRHIKPLLTVAALLVLSISFTVELRDERDRALAFENYFLGAFETSEEELNTKAIIDNATSNLTQLDDQPQVQIRLMATFGWVYRSLGDYEQAREMLWDGLEIRRKLYGDRRLEIASELYKIGILDLETGHYPEAEDTLRAAMAMATELKGGNHWLVGNCHSRIAEVAYERGQLVPAATGAEKALEIFNRSLAGRSPSLRQAIDLASTLDLMVGVHYQQKQYSTGEATARQALEMLIKATGPTHLEVGNLWNSLGMTLRRLERLDEAVDALSEAARIDRELLGDQSLRLGIRLLNLGTTYRKQGEIDLALSSCQQALEMTIAIGSADHFNVPLIKRCLQRAEAARHTVAVGDG